MISETRVSSVSVLAGYDSMDELHLGGGLRAGTHLLDKVYLGRVRSRPYGVSVAAVCKDL